MTTVSGVLRSREGDIFLPQTHATLVSGLSTVATSGSYNDLSNKPDLTGFITNSVNDLINYYKKTETYTQTEVNNLIGAIQQFRYEIVANTSAVSTPANNVLYLIGPTGSGADKYEEYVYANSTWTKIGDTSIDLSGYVTTTALNTALADYALSSSIPTALSDLTDDSTHRTVTDTEKEQWMPRIYIGTCGTAAATVNKVVTVESFPLDGNGKPLVGTMIGVKFTNTNSATAPKLNVNETGAASIYYNSAEATSTSSVYGGSASRYAYYVWDGTYWVWVTHGTDNNDNTLAYNVRYNSASKTAIDGFRRYRILFTSADDAHWVPATTSTSTNATASRTVNQTPINPFGQIVYYGSTTTVSEDGTPGATVLYTQYNITLGYSFNRTGAALTLTTKTPVYIKCAPQSNGSAIIDADTPYVQALPSTEDGKIYIYLGVASSATAVELAIVHPVYYYKDGLVRPWTNVPVNSELTLTTWQNLVNLRNNNQLIPGHQYRITDYVTRIMFEQCRSMEHPFDIIVVADSTNELNEDAKAILHEGDSYFNEFQNTDSGTELNFRWSHMEGWELKYCLDNDRDRFYWACDYEYIESYIEQNGISHIFCRDSSNDIDGLYCWSVSSNEPGILISLIYTKVEHPSVGTTVYDSDGETELGEISNYCSGPGKGVIYHMKDDQDNVAEYDFKNVQFLKRFNGFDEYNYHNFSYYGSDQEWFYPLTFHLIDDNYDPVQHYIADASMVSTEYNDSVYTYYGNSGNDCRNNYLGCINEYSCVVTVENSSNYSPAYLPQDWFVENVAYALKEGVDKKVQSSRFMPRYNINESDDDWSNYDSYLATSKAIDNRITDRTQYMIEYGPARYAYNMSNWDMMVFEWIPEFGTSADIYLKTTDSNYAWTVSVSTNYLNISYSWQATWNSYTPTTLGSDGMYYVKLGTVSSTKRYLCVKGTSANVGSGNANTYCKFHITAPCYLWGNMMSLIGKASQNDISDDTFNVSYLFNNLFKDEINLFSHPNYRLFITSVRIPQYSYQHMFDGCKNMTISPYVSFTNAGNTYCCTDIFSNTDNLKCLITGDTNSTYINKYISDKKFNELYYIAGKNAYSNEKALYTTNDIQYPLMSIIAHLLNHSLFEKIKLQQLHTSSDYSVDPNKMFGFGTITDSSVTFTLSSKEDSITSNHYFWTFETGSTAPTITWPSGLSWFGGSAPTINANKHYEISVLNNIAVCMEV